MRRVAILSAIALSFVSLPATASPVARWHSIPTIPGGAANGFYDPIRDRMIVVPGDFGIGRSELWTIDLANPDHWKAVPTSGDVPPVRTGRCAIFDPVGYRLILFGGTTFSAEDSVDADVWVLRLAASPLGWEHVTPAGGKPLRRFWATAAYDSIGQRAILFGGYCTYSYTYYGRLLNDVWALELSPKLRWTQIVPSNLGPTGRYSTAATIDPVRQRLIVAAGADSIALWSGNGPRSDIWALSLTGTPEWTLLRQGAPPGDCYAAHVTLYDPIRDRMLVLGGRDSTWYPTTDHLDTRALTFGPTNDLVHVIDSAPGPGGRENPAVIYDPRRDAVVLTSGAANDVWKLDLGGTPHWTQLVPFAGTPPLRFGQAQAYDAAREHTVFFSGRYTYYVAYEYPTTYFTDLWSLKLTDHPIWTQLAPAGGPPATRQYASLTADPAADRMWLFSGSVTVGIQGPSPPTGAERIEIGSIGTRKYYSDLWRLDLAGPSWTPITPSAQWPERRDGHAAVLDTRRHRLLIFGGRDSLGTRNDAWAIALDGANAASAIAAVGAPPAPRAFAAAIYDSLLDRLLVSGGTATDGTPLADTWQLSLSGTPTWTQLAVSGAPATFAPRPSWVEPVHGRLVTLGSGLASGPTRLGAFSPTSATWDSAGFLPAPSPLPGDLLGRSASYDLSIGQAVVLWGSYGRRGEYNEDTAWTVELIEPDALDVPRSPVSGGPVLAMLGSNPVRGRLEVRAQLAGATGRLELYDLRGRMVMRRALAGGPAMRTEALDVSGFSPGIYWLRLAGAGPGAALKVCVLR